MVQNFSSIGAGPFEFPISGRFRLSEQARATVFEAEGSSRSYIVASFNNVSAPLSEPQDVRITALEQMVRRNWERFAEKERGLVVVPFARSVAGGAVLFHMATEFKPSRQTEYYVQFVATNGKRFASVFATGDGQAIRVFEELLPIMLRVHIHPE